MLAAELGAVPAAARPYIDVDDLRAAAVYGRLIVAAAADAGFDPGGITGRSRVAFVNGIVGATSTGRCRRTMQIPLIDAAAGAPGAGLAYADIGKSDYYSSIGARYFVVKDGLRPLRRHRRQGHQGSSEVLGAAAAGVVPRHACEGSKAHVEGMGQRVSASSSSPSTSPRACPSPFKRSFY